MNMHRSAILAAIALGALLLPSCIDPPPPPYGPNGQRGPGFLPPPGRGDGYVGPQRPDPYGNPYAPEGGDPYAQGPQASGQGYGPPPQAPDRTVDPQPTAPKRTDYPTATKTAKPNQVLSPYAPYNVIDVSGIQSGKLAKDPSTGEIFRVP